MMPQSGDEPVPGYRLIRRLGSGGMGEVWLAEAPGGADAALKFVPLEGKRGLREWRALHLVRQIHHPHLLSITGLWLRDGGGRLVDPRLPSDSQETAPSLSACRELIIAMTLGGQDLFERLLECQTKGQTGVPRQELLTYLADAAKAIDYLNQPIHDLGEGLTSIQHCDIKPQNILITGGVAQVADFGLASALGDVRSTAAFAGTLAYAAPEVLTNGRPSATTDQYSLAMTYHELATGELPYESESRFHVEQAIVLGALDFSRLTPAERRVVAHATALSPQKRYKSCGEFITALREAVDHPEPLQRRLGPRVWLPAGVAAAILVAIIALLLTGSPEASPTDKDWTMASSRQQEAAARLLAAQKRVGQTRTNAAQWDRLVRELEGVVVALKRSPKSSAADRLLAQAHHLRGLVALRRVEIQADPHLIPLATQAIDDFHTARRLSSEFVCHGPELALAHRLRGEMRLRSAPPDPAKAQADFEEALRHCLALGGESRLTGATGGFCADLLQLRGRCRLLRGQIEQAIADFSQALVGEQQHGAGSLTRYWRGRAWLASNQPQKAAEDFAQLLQHPGTRLRVLPAIRLARGEALLALQQFPAAIAELTLAISRRHESSSPSASISEPACDLAKAHFLRGQCFLQMANGLSGGGGVVPILSRLAASQADSLALADFTAAKEHAAEDAGGDEIFAKAAVERAHLLKRQGAHRQAIAEFDVHRPTAPADARQADILRGLAQSYLFYGLERLQLGQPAEDATVHLAAADELFRALKSSPQSKSDDYLNWAFVAGVMGKPSEQIQRYTEAITALGEQDQNPAEALALRAKALFPLDKGGALADFEKALQLAGPEGTPDFPRWRLHDQAKNCCIWLRDAAGAKDHLDAAIRHAPADIELATLRDLHQIHLHGFSTESEARKQVVQSLTRLLEAPYDEDAAFDLAWLFAVDSEVRDLTQAARFSLRYLAAQLRDDENGNAVK